MPRFELLLLLLSAGCGAGATGLVDAADAASPVDAALSVDARAETDAELGPDVGSVTDSGFESDAGMESDAEIQGDAAAAPDAAEGPDRQMDDGGSWAPYAVLSLNLHCLKLDGTSFATNADRFQAIAAFAAREGVAVVLAQEVCVRLSVSAADLLRQALEGATGAAWTSHWVFVHQAWTGTPDEAQEGVAIFSRGTLSPAPTLRYRTQGPLSRSMAVAKLPPELGGLIAHTVHLDVSASLVRAGQGLETAAYAVTEADPSLGLLVGGDFNDVTSSETCGAMTAAGFVEASAGLDPGGIDHVYVHRGAGVATSGARIVFRGGNEPPVSDHPGVLVGLRPGSGETVTPTRFVASYSGLGYLAVRGSVAPLSWTRGWPAWPTGAGAGRHKLVLTELSSSAFEYKWLRDDSAWQNGDNLPGVGGSTLSAAPTFP